MSKRNCLRGVGMSALVCAVACADADVAQEASALAPTEERVATEPAASPPQLEEPRTEDRSSSQTSTVDPSRWGEIDAPDLDDAAIAARVEAILAEMSLPQKVGQVIQGDIGSTTPEDVARYHLGSVLNGGNSGPYGDLRARPEDWVRLADEFWEASMGEEGAGVPVIWGTDAVHGHSNVLGATIYPHNIGLGATRDEDLLRRIGEATATEIRTTGLDWTFAPTIAVARDDRWGRTYESYAEDPELVARLGAAMVRGLQGEPNTAGFLRPPHTLATAKHFLGDGGTRGGEDQGETIGDEAVLRDVHGAPYAAALEAGLQSVMASFSSWEGRKMHGYDALLTGVLKDQWGFSGFVVGDWNGHGQVRGCTPTDCPQALRAGLDLYMAPDSWRGLYTSLLRDVRDGTVPEEVLDEAVRRVLTVKARTGLLDAPKPSERPMTAQWTLLGSDEHTDLAREAVAKSAVLLKNDGVLPLSRAAHVLIVGDAADDLAKLSGGWTVDWQGGTTTRDDFPQAESVLDGVRRVVEAAGGRVTVSRDGRLGAAGRPDVAIAVYGEPPYAEFRGDRTDLAYSPDDRSDVEALERLAGAGVPTVSVFVSGRPLWVNPELNASNAFVAAFLPGTQAGALADLLFAEGGTDFTGRLSFSWPKRPGQTPLNIGDEDYDPLFAYGYGLSLAEDGALATLDVSDAVGKADPRVLLADGSLRNGWALTLEDAQGATQWAGTPARSPSGSLSVRTADLGRQENAIELAFAGPAEATFWRRPTDLSEAASADRVIEFSYVVEAETDAELTLRASCGEGCEAVFDVSEMTARRLGTITTYVVPLSCLTEAGVDLSKLRSLGLGANSTARLILERVAVARNTDVRRCPPPVGGEPG